MLDLSQSGTPSKLPPSLKGSGGLQQSVQMVIHKFDTARPPKNAGKSRSQRRNQWQLPQFPASCYHADAEGRYWHYMGSSWPGAPMCISDLNGITPFHIVTHIEEYKQFILRQSKPVQRNKEEQKEYDRLSSVRSRAYYKEKMRILTIASQRLYVVSQSTDFGPHEILGEGDQPLGVHYLIKCTQPEAKYIKGRRAPFQPGWVSR